MTKTVCGAVGFALALASMASADVVVPNSATSTEADGTFALTATAVAGRTFQLTIDSGQLTGLVGQQIAGLQWRLNGAATAAWPPANVTYTAWDVYLGPGVDPSAMSNTFASNFTAAPTQVRSGPQSFNAGSFTAGGSPNSFGPSLSFTTPYLYTGGDLTIEMRFSAQSGTTTTPSFDAVLASGGPGNGWGVGFGSRWTADAAGITGGNANFLVTNLVVQTTTCYANCDSSTIAPVLNVNDFTCFLNRYAAGDSYANCDASTIVPTLNVNDFT